MRWSRYVATLVAIVVSGAATAFGVGIKTMSLGLSWLLAFMGYVCLLLALVIRRSRPVSGTPVRYPALPSGIRHSRPVSGTPVRYPALPSGIRPSTP